MLFQRCFVNVETMSINIHRLNFHFQSTKFQRRNNVGSSSLNRRNSIDVVSTLFANVETTSINIHRLNFHFQSTKFQRRNNVGSSTLNRRNSIDVVSTLFANVETTLINVRRLNFHFQPNINIDVFAGYMSLNCVYIVWH